MYDENRLLDLPLLPLRDVVVYPHMVIPLFVGREKSIHALEVAMAASKQIFLVAQRMPRMTIPSRTACMPSVPSPPSCSC